MTAGPLYHPCNVTVTHPAHNWDGPDGVFTVTYHCPGAPDPFGRDGSDIDEATGEPIIHDTYRDNEPPTVATENRYPTNIAVQAAALHAPTEAPNPTHIILHLMEDGTYRKAIAGTWTPRDAVKICDALNGYPPRTP